MDITPRQMKSAAICVDRVIADSRRIRNDARILNVREQLWELHTILRHCAASDAALRGYAAQRSERIGSSLAARRAGM